jgi:lipopolysaccharide transport system ATP-binding protein
MRDAVLTVRDLGKRYHAKPAPRGAAWWDAVRHACRLLRRPAAGADAFWALRGVTFDLAAGERLGIIGRNGAGKSTLLKILARVVYPTTGEARIRGRVTSLLEIGTGFNPELSGRENVYLNAYLHGLTREEVDQRFEAIVEFSGVRDFLELPVKHYSTGMFLRLAFSVAAHLDPDIMLLDEVLAVGDLTFQQRCLRRMETLGSDGRTVLFVSHSMDAVVRFCTRCIWLDQGRVVADGSPAEVTRAYLEQALGGRSREYWVADRSWTFMDGAPPDDGHAEPAAAEPGRPCGERVDAGRAGAPAAGAAAGPAAPAPPASAAGVPAESELVRIVAARVVNARGDTVATVRTNEPVGIEVVADVLKPGKNIQPALHFRTSHDALAFVVAYTDPAFMHVGLPPGRHATTAWIPPNLLNAGVLSVTIEMATPDPLERHCRIERALTFHVTDPIDGDPESARGLYGRDFPGVVRPRLRWETSAVAAVDSRPRAAGPVATHAG